MHDADKWTGDSYTRRGGWIPGMTGAPAFTLTRPGSSPLPVLIAAPHGGRSYPATVLGALRQAEETTLRLEDRLVDQLAQAVARETGAALLVAHAPRAMIDLNRALEDMDWSMIRRGLLPLARPGNGGQGGRRARSGLGLVPRRLNGVGELWTRLLDPEELESRIDGIHRAYHDALAGELRELRARWGAALLIDLHSMPPLSAPGLDEVAPQFVIGDRFGASCGGDLAGLAVDHFRIEGHGVAHNRPYAGGYVLDRHGSPRRNIHALQLEVCRSAYLDSRLAEPGEGFAVTAAVIARLVRRLGEEVASIGRGESYALAAE